MAITVSGTQITFNDATTQTTAGITSAVTSLNGQTGAITNTSTNTIGSYIVGGVVSNSYNVSYGATIAGSSIRCAVSQNAGNESWGLGSAIQMNIGYTQANPSLSGTWRIMSYLKNQDGIDGNGAPQGLWVRIS